MDGNETRRSNTVTKTVKNPPEDVLVQLSREKTYATIPDKPETEDGMKVNEFVEVETEREETSNYSDDSFESEETSDTSTGKSERSSISSECDSDDDMEKASDAEEYTTVELGLDIKIKVPTDLENAFTKFKALKWTSEEKNKNLIVEKKLKDFTYVTDVYRLVTTGGSQSTNITNVNERRKPRSKQCVMSLKNDLIDKITFLVPVEEKFAPKQNSDVTIYTAVIECGGNEWKTVPATLKDGYIEFKCSRLNSFGLASSPKSQHGVVDQSGKLVSTGNDGRLNINIEEGCVTSRQKYHYSIQRPDAEYVRETKNSPVLVAAVSDKLQLHYDKSQFRKPVTIDATLTSVDENSSDFEEFEVKAVTCDNENFAVMNITVERSGGKHYQMKLHKPSGVLLAAIRKGTNYEKDKSRLKNEVDRFYGIRRTCTILLFYIKRLGNHIHFVSACCLKSDKDIVLTRFSGKGSRLVYESEDILLPPQQRVRIHPVGCIGGPSGPRSNFFLFFMYATKDNICEFKVEISRRMGGSVGAIVEFSADNQLRGNLTTAEFDLDFIFKASKAPRLHRSTTNLSEVFKPRGITRLKSTL